MTEQRVMVPKGPRVEEVRRDRSRWRDTNQPPLPGWLEIRDVQLDAVERIAKEFKGGARVVMLDAPTGTGKTAIAELVRRELEVTRGLYVCTTKSLQEQVARDFEYARVLKGRVNYTPTKMSARQASGYRQGGWGTRGLSVSCADCDATGPKEDVNEQSCSYCFNVGDCPYRVARSEALKAPVGVLNTSYLLAEANGPGRFAGRELVVADEADLLEGELMGYVELRVGKRIVDKLGLEVPKKGSHMATIRKWLEGEVMGELDRYAGTVKGDLEGRREKERIARLIGDIERVVGREEGWVRDGDAEGRVDSLVLKPVSVQDVGDKYLWRHADRWLLMSGTTVSAEGQADMLGLHEAGVEWASVEVPMQFDVANRRVVFAPVGNMTRKGQEEGGTGKVLRGVERVLEKHPDVNVLVHTHTYKLAREVSDYVKSRDVRPVMTYEAASGRDDALASFKRAATRGGGVLVAASMDRGVDLPGELCRVQVIVKVPMASLGSRQVSERMRQPGGQMWYLMNTVRSVMQMTGRAVRSMDDYAVTYVLDEHFGKILKDGKKAGLFPQWWLDGLEVGRVKEYL